MPFPVDAAGWLRTRRSFLNTSTAVYPTEKRWLLRVDPRLCACTGGIRFPATASAASVSFFFFSRVCLTKSSNDTVDDATMMGDCGGLKLVVRREYARMLEGKRVDVDLRMAGERVNGDNSAMMNARTIFPPRRNKKPAAKSSRTKVGSSTASSLHCTTQRLVSS